MIIFFLSADPLIPSNPNLVNNATHVVLLWSPPFIWPGYRIAYYNVSVTTRNKGSTAYYRVNSNVDYSNPIVSFANEIYRTETLMCTELYFCIAPTTTSNHSLVQVCNSSDSSLSPCEYIYIYAYFFLASVFIELFWCIQLY